jgi:hypothetical protein
MPIEYQIDHARRLVLAKASGALTKPDFFEYQRTVWSRPDVAGFDELIDMTDVQGIEIVTADRAMDLATLSAEMDVDGPPSKLAIVAPGDLAYGLGRMYQTYRSMQDRSNKQVGVYRSMRDALSFLGKEGETSPASTSL